MPAPEVLKPQSESASENTASGGDSSGHKKVVLPKKSRHGSYRPSHKATFIGILVVVFILIANGGIIYFVLRGQTEGTGKKIDREEVTLSTETLSGLGVRRNNVGDLGTELTIGPNSKFNGTVTIAGDTSVGGQLKLNSKFTASDASLAKLQAGETAVNTLNVNGDTTTNNLNLRKDLNVTGVTRMQGAVTISSVLTAGNNLNVVGNLAVGGLLSVRNFQASSLVSDTTLVIGGHIITRGSAPNVGPGGPALGSNGTVSISGNDAAGTIGVNVGVGASAGALAHVAFRQSYGSTPHVVVTGVGAGMANLYISRSTGGFTVSTTTPVAPGGYAIDYIVVQ